MQDNILKFYADKYYTYQLVDIRDIKVDENVSDAEKERQLRNISRLYKVINREKHIARDMAKRFNRLLLQGQYQQLDALARKLIEEKQKLPSGRPMLFAFYDGLDLDIPKSDTAKYRQRLALVDTWIESTQSETSRIASIRLNLDYAWAYRGSGYSREVTKAGRQKFAEILHETARKAEAIRARYTDDLTLYTALIRIHKATNRDKAPLYLISEEAAAIDPAFYTVYYQTIHALLPRWGGSIERVKRYVQDTSNKYGVGENEDIYFRLVRFVFNSTDEYDFPRYEFNWKRVLKSFDALQKKQDMTEYDYHLIAKMAGVFGDSESTSRFLALTTGQWNHFAKRAWRKKSTLEQFELWAAQTPDAWFSSIMNSFLSVNDVVELDNLVIAYVNAGGDINRTDVYGNSLLHNAVDRGYDGMVDLLINLGADASKLDGKGQNSLYLAAKNNRLRIVARLLATDIDASAGTTGKQSTALHTAAYKGFSNVVALLVESNRELLNQANKFGDTALHFAATKGHVDTIELLLNFPGIDLNARSSSGDTALHYAVTNDHIDVVRQLVARGAVLSISNHNNHTPLSLAREQKLDTMVAYLQSKRAKDSGSVISHASRKKSTELYQQSTAFFTKMDVSRAEALIAQALEYNPNNALAYHGLAFLYLYHSSRYPEAAKAIERSISLDPNDVESYYTAGRIYFELKQPEKYTPMFQKYIALAPDTYNANDLKTNYAHLLTLEKSGN